MQESIVRAKASNVPVVEKASSKMQRNACHLSSQVSCAQRHNVVEQQMSYHLQLHELGAHSVINSTKSKSDELG